MNLPFYTRVAYKDPRTNQPCTGVVVGHDGAYVSVKRDGLQPWEQWDRVGHGWRLVRELEEYERLAKSMEEEVE